MISERIKVLASEISKKDVVLDVGCDHGYLSIYLKENNLCKEVYASDVSENALNSAINNFKKRNIEIKTFVSDGFKNIPIMFNTAVISGMGTSTILNILNHEKTPDKLVLGTHNEHYKLRKNLNELGYKLIDEQAIFEKGHYYIILLYIKGKQKLSRRELKFGISNDDNYYEYLLNKNMDIIKKVPFKKKIKLYYDNLILKGLIKRK